MDDPNVRYYVTGENKWRSGDNWPLPETQFTPFYLDSWERLRTRPIEPDSWEGTNEPDAFVQSPPTLTNKISKLRYISDPLSDDLLLFGNDHKAASAIDALQHFREHNGIDHMLYKCI